VNKLEICLLVAFGLLSISAVIFLARLTLRNYWLEKKAPLFAAAKIAALILRNDPSNPAALKIIKFFKKNLNK
tara:strand:+ start:2969 stop:3187 length:219 start_codon:yes stop_codon:yes gene_type:complete